MYLPVVLEAGGLRSRCWQGCARRRGSKGGNFLASSCFRYWVHGSGPFVYSSGFQFVCSLVGRGYYWIYCSTELDWFTGCYRMGGSSRAGGREGEGGFWGTQQGFLTNRNQNPGRGSGDPLPGASHTHGRASQPHSDDGHPSILQQSPW